MRPSNLARASRRGVLDKTKGVRLATCRQHGLPLLKDDMHNTVPGDSFSFMAPEN